MATHCRKGALMKLWLPKVERVGAERLMDAVNSLMERGMSVAFAREEVVVTGPDRFWVCSNPCCVMHVAQVLEGLVCGETDLDQRVRDAIETRLAEQMQQGVGEA